MTRPREFDVKRKPRHAWRRWLLFGVGVFLAAYVIGYLAVRNSDAYAAAQAFAAQRGLFDPGASPGLGWIGFRISRSGRSGRAAFALVGDRDGRERYLHFVLERDRRSGAWSVHEVSADQRRILLYPAEGQTLP